MDDTAFARLRRKMAERDKKIEGLKRRVAALESALATAHFDAKRTPIEIRKAVQDALCNVRMIPVLGIGRNARIIEVRTTQEDDHG